MSNQFNFKVGDVVQFTDEFLELRGLCFDYSGYKNKNIQITGIKPRYLNEFEIEYKIVESGKIMSIIVSKNNLIYYTPVFRKVEIKSEEVLCSTVVVKNNDGRNTCFWCGALTKKVPGFSYNSFYTICSSCGK